jgi:hypothetical protein
LETVDALESIDVRRLSGEPACAGFRPNVAMEAVDALENAGNL